MPTFYDSQGNSYTLNQQIGRGGEGTVFYCPDDLSLVAKIYHEPIDDEKAEKLRWMAQNKNDKLLKVAAWIVDTLHDSPNGKIVGFLMPRVKAKEIHELYSLKSRRVHFPQATWQFLVHSAANIARAFYVLHKHEHIMGDVNHGNCVVLADGTVKLIDCDSYSIRTEKMRYACEVGVATHLAPELQGADLSEIERENKHDNFGLAVIIFQLLFLGRHPFAGNYLGAEDKSLEDCIRERRFAYGNQEHTKVTQPPGTLSLSQIPPRVAQMFERAFFTDNRPEAREWIEALEDLSENLKQCSIHIGHHFFNKLFECPWCEIELKTGLMLFPFIGSTQNGTKQNFDIFTVENLLATLDIPQNLPAKPFKPQIIPPPSNEIKKLKEKNQTRIYLLTGTQFLLVLFLTITLGAGFGFILGAILMLFMFAIFYNSYRVEREKLEEKLYDFRWDWEKLEREWEDNINPESLQANLALVRTKVYEHQSLQHQSIGKIKSLNDLMYQYKRDSYLTSFKLDDAKIAGIRQNHKDIFKRFGIRTATDIDAQKLSFIPSVSDEIIEKLFEWRKDLEKSFEFPSDTELPEADKNRFALQFTEKRGKIEKEIETLLVTLRSGSSALKHKQRQIAAKAEIIGQNLIQAESNFAAIGSSMPMIAALFLTTVIIPIFGAAFQSSSTQYHTNISYSNSISSGRGTAANTAPNTAKSNYPVKENLTNEEISQMIDWERTKSAESLLNQGAELIDQGKFAEGESKLRYALKFSENNIEILNSLGVALYEQKKFTESVTILKKSLNLNSENTTTNFLIGANYIKLHKYLDARIIFEEIVRKNPQSFEGNFNLGLAFKGLKNYEMAVLCFKDAEKINPSDIDVHYELGYCAAKNGDKETAKEQFDKLFLLDTKRAEKLRNDANLPIGIGRGEGNGTGYGFGSGSGSGY